MWMSRDKESYLSKCNTEFSLRIGKLCEIMQILLHWSCVHDRHHYFKYSVNIDRHKISFNPNVFCFLPKKIVFWTLKRQVTPVNTGKPQVKLGNRNTDLWRNNLKGKGWWQTRGLRQSKKTEMIIIVINMVEDRWLFYTFEKFLCTVAYIRAHICTLRF